MAASGSVWFITGASSGLGLSLAQHVVACGARVIGTVRKTGVPAVKELESRGAKFLSLDLNDGDARVKEVVAEAESIYGQIDVLVNNAATAVLGAMEDMDMDACRRQFESNFFAPIAIIQSVLPGMRKRKSGSIVNISSVAGLSAMPTCTMYSGSKFALEGMSEALAQEVAPFNINVLLIEPGGFRTNFLNAYDDSPRSQHYQQGPVADRMKVYDVLNQNQPGDPAKASSIIFDFVEGRGEVGKALKGKTERLLLGSDCVTRVEEKMTKLQDSIDLTRPFAITTDFEA